MFSSDQSIIWGFISAVFIVLFCLAFMPRQHYALTLQNRIIRLELRNSYFSFTGKKLEYIEHLLTDDQIFALRFASDEELSVLIERALEENLFGQNSKKAIVNWKVVYDRVKQL